MSTSTSSIAISAERPSRLGGIGLAEIEDDVLGRHADAYAQAMAKLPDPGFVRFRKEGEAHAFNPTAVKALQAAALTSDDDDFQNYRDLVDSHPLTAIRDLIDLSAAGPSDSDR